MLTIARVRAIFKEKGGINKKHKINIREVKNTYIYEDC